jgi:flagellar motor switch protein FliN
VSDATTNETTNTATNTVTTNTAANDGRDQAGVHNAVPLNAEAASSSAHLDLLLDVPLEATIRFGEGQLLLRDILSAAPGAIFPLDRELNAPADLLVAGRLMARGEVVVVNGNFGLRVTELAAGQPLAQAALPGAPQPAPLLKE